MLVAKKPWWDGREGNRQVCTVRVVERQSLEQRPKEQRPKDQAGYLVAFTLMIFAGFFYIGLSFQGRAVDERLIELQTQVNSLEVENQRLATLTSQYSSFERLEQVATTELGLVKPSTEQILPVKY